MSNPQKLRGRQVQFCIRDVHVPEPADILTILHSHDLLRGRVTDLTDSGTELGAFAVVDVEDIAQPLVVPTACLKEYE